MSGSGAHIRGLDEAQQVTVTEDAENVRVNGRPVSGGSTVTAGTDVSTDLDDMDVEIDVGGGDVTTQPGDIEIDIDLDDGDRPSGGSGGSTRPSQPDTPDDTEEPSQPGNSTSGGSYRDEDGNIIIDFDDLLNGGR